MKNDEACISILMVTKTIPPFSDSDVICLLFVTCSSIPTEMFLDDIFLTVSVGVTFPSSYIIRTYKTFESFLKLFEVECSNTMVSFEVPGIDFILPSFACFKGLLFSVLSFCWGCYSVLSSSFEFKEFRLE